MLNRKEIVDHISEFFKIESNDVKMLTSNESYDGRMDEECIRLCDAMNAVNGIITTESCCGHGKTPFCIWFKAISFKGLFFVSRCIDKRYFKHCWDYSVSVGDVVRNEVLPTVFRWSRKVIGDEAYKQADDLVMNMNLHLNHKNFKKCFGLSLKDFQWS